MSERKVVAGIDVAKDVVMVCVLHREASGFVAELAEFKTARPQLLEMKAWLRSRDCTSALMESTGSYWKPVYEVLEEQEEGKPEFHLCVANAEAVKRVPGRKTDYSDARWLAQLYYYELVNPSFVPPRKQRDLRDYLRLRRSLVETHAQKQNEVAELLQTAQLKLDSIVSDLFGVSGRRMLEALAAGVTEPERLAVMAAGTLRQKAKELRVVLEGAFRPHHQFQLRVMLDLIKSIEQSIESVDQRIDECLDEPFKEALERLMEIPGFGRETGLAVLAEVGVDMKVFGNVERFTAWVGVCPGNNVSGKKRLRGHGKKTRKGNPYAKLAFTIAAVAAAKNKDSYLRHRKYRLQARLGSAGKAIIATAHTLARIVYRLLSVPGLCYSEAQLVAPDERARQHQIRRAVKALENLGHRVILEPLEPPLTLQPTP